MELNEREVTSIYKKLLDAWNNQDAHGMADVFADDGEQIDCKPSTGSGRFSCSKTPLLNFMEDPSYLNE